MGAGYEKFLAVAISILICAGVFFPSAEADTEFGVPGEPGTDGYHTERPRYVRLADNGSLFISDQNRIMLVQGGVVTWQLNGSFCDIEWTGPDTWAALNDSYHGPQGDINCEKILFSNGTSISTPHRANRLLQVPGGFLIEGNGQMSHIDQAGTIIDTCTGLAVRDMYDGYILQQNLQTIDLATCSIQDVIQISQPYTYAFYPFSNGTFAFTAGYGNGTYELVWGNTTYYTPTPVTDLHWNGTALAGAQINNHTVRIWNITPEPPPDTDGDGLLDPDDDCPTVWGNATDLPGCPDADGDGIADVNDPCPDDPQDLCTDGDGDGVLDYEDDCPSTWGNATDLPGCPDTDGDGIADVNDPCPTDKLDGCLDTDGDGWNDSTDDCPSTWGNSTDDYLGCPDTDGDGVSDYTDPCPSDPADRCFDADGDGWNDSVDDCPTTAGNSTMDRLGCPDRDGDHWSDQGDAFPDDPLEWLDLDLDGVGDNSDGCLGEWGNATDLPGCPDTDGDGIADVNDPCPFDPNDLCDDPVPDDVEFRNIRDTPGIDHFIWRFWVNSDDCYGSAKENISGAPAGETHHWEVGTPLSGGWYDWEFNFSGWLDPLKANTSYDFTLVCYINMTREGWLNLTGTTLPDPDATDGTDGSDGNETPDGDGGEDLDLLNPDPTRNLLGYIILGAFVAAIVVSVMPSQQGRRVKRRNIRKLDLADDPFANNSKQKIPAPFIPPVIPPPPSLGELPGPDELDEFDDDGLLGLPRVPFDTGMMRPKPPKLNPRLFDDND